MKVALRRRLCYTVFDFALKKGKSLETSGGLFETNAFLHFTTELGSSFLTLAAGFFRAAWSVIKIPFVFLANCFLLTVRAVSRFVKSSFHEQVGNEKFFTGKLWGAVRNFFTEAKANPRTSLYLLGHYIRRGRARYRTVIKYFLLILIPSAAALMLAVTINHFAAQCIALRIDTANGTLGYVASENDYLEARDLAKERLSLDSGMGDISSLLLPDVTYTLALIDINKYTGPETLCDRLIESSEANIVNACGIYVDGEFLCAVKNESDAKRVFNSILEAEPDYGGDGIVTFVQSIDYVEGLYPDSEYTVWDSSKLAQTVSSEVGNDSFYTAAEGDTLADVAERFGLTADALLELNPGQTYGARLQEGDRLRVSAADKFLTVKVVKTEVVNESIPFDTVEVPSDALYTGTSRTVVSGVDGIEQVTNLVTYIDGKKVNEREVSRLTLQEPVDKRVQVGTKALDAGYNYSQHYGGVLVWPAVNAFNINSPYGWRWGKLHSALDIGSSSGTSLGKLVVAAAAGTVVISGVHSSYGYYIKIDHGNGFQTLYAHCLEGSLMVNVGDHVDAGQAIARVGQSGYATGPHLHFEVRVNGTCVDPGPYLGLY